MRRLIGRAAVLNPDVVNVAARPFVDRKVRSGGVTMLSARDAITVYMTPASVSPSALRSCSSGDPTVCWLIAIPKRNW